MCEHKHVIRTMKMRYFFENGWQKDVVEKDCDFAEHEEEIEYWCFKCEDCGEILDEM